MKRNAVGILVVLLAGCGSDSDGGQSTVNEISQDEFKQDSEMVIDESTGQAHKQMAVEEQSEITIRLDKDQVFSLESGDEYAEKLVVQGNLTIK
ncbi:hypothetical protein [Vibrio sp. WXL103]|uniref:hypothetical protein n=1 Tax=unclassified Vibrio TaxID=2614977 RepID=UPI003EC596E1